MKDKAREVLERMEKDRGFSRQWWRILAERDPEFLDSVHKLNMHVLYRQEGLPRKYVELLQLVIDVQTSYEPGIRLHLHNALKEGLTEVEIIQALEICTMSGIHYVSSILPVLEDEVKMFKGEQRANQE